MKKSMSIAGLLLVAIIYCSGFQSTGDPTDPYDPAPGGKYKRVVHYDCPPVPWGDGYSGVKVNCLTGKEACRESYCVGGPSN